MKKLGYVVLIIVLVLLLGKACIRRDIPENIIQPGAEQEELLTLNIYPANRKNVTINS